jgi:transcriptional regulator with XRE-family HTH domain
MPKDDNISGRQVAAARALAGISRSDLASAAKIPAAALGEIEAGGSVWVQPVDIAHALRQAFENFGVLFVPEDGNVGAGVRLKFTRADARQIGRLEGEGGIVKDDDVP